MDYLSQLKELLKRYNQDELAAELGVSVRSIQLYLKENNPTIPQVKMQRKINEVHTKLLSTAKPAITHVSQEDYQKKYIDLHEKYSLLLEKNLAAERDTKKALNRELSEFREEFTEFRNKIGSSLKTFEEFAIARMTYLKTILAVLELHREAVEKKPLQEIVNQSDTILAAKTREILKDRNSS